MRSTHAPVSLHTIFTGFPLPFSPVSVPDIPITGIAIDSRRVGLGNLFIARQGGSVDGHAFIPSALERGAAAVVGEQDLTGLPVPYLRVADSVQAVTWLAAAFYDWPGGKLTVVGVTGTDGKTTTSNLLYQILLAAGLKVGLISTVNAVIDGEVLDTGFHVTTPDAPDVQQYLAKMVAAGLTHVVLETTSHGLAQHRVDASQYDVAVVTNITHEHLDQHGSYENYRAAKGRLLQLLEITLPKPQGNPRLAVLNRDDSSFEYLSSLLMDLPRVDSVSYGLHSHADLVARNATVDPGGIRFEALGPDFCVPVTSPLVGEFNISNCLAALAASVRGLGVDPETTARGIAAMRGVPGRMERIDLGQPFTAIVDFAHTPNALRVAIETVKQIPPFASSDASSEASDGTGPGEGTAKKHRVISIFGSAGLRDKEKRRLMAETSAELADISILTAEDPRTESLDVILEEMAAGSRSRGGVEGKDFFRVPDRGEAIRLGVRLASPGDVVIVCGKGHEQSMCFGEIEYPWDDRIAMRSALSNLFDFPGPEMPYLPTQE
jgi:UDP-N-acetylmuramoyl-L-alanyl-D-glutamate--2,6-diaminopimelate ligase